VVRRVLPAPPHVVFDEWLDPVGMTEWMCPRPAGPHRRGWEAIAVQLGEALSGRR
jgi:uncharacterized protein YndB with AHSA1/START domain